MRRKLKPIAMTLLFMLLRVIAFAEPARKPGAILTSASISYWSTTAGTAGFTGPPLRARRRAALPGWAGACHRARTVPPSPWF